MYTKFIFHLNKIFERYGIEENASLNYKIKMEVDNYVSSDTFMKNISTLIVNEYGDKEKDKIKSILSYVIVLIGDCKPMLDQNLLVTTDADIILKAAKILNDIFKQTN